MLEVYRNIVTWPTSMVARTKDSDTKKFVATNHTLTSFSICYAKLLQSCLTLCDPIDGLPGSSVPGILQARTTGVGCHFLLQRMKVNTESEVAQSCPTLRDLMNCRLPGSSVHGTFQARVLEWGATAFSI